MNQKANMSRERDFKESPEARLWIKNTAASPLVSTSQFLSAGYHIFPGSPSHLVIWVHFWPEKCFKYKFAFRKMWIYGCPMFVKTHYVLMHSHFSELLLLSAPLSLSVPMSTGCTSQTPFIFFCRLKDYQGYIFLTSLHLGNKNYSCKRLLMAGVLGRFS